MTGVQTCALPIYGASEKDIDDLMLHGWEGFNSFNNERLDKVFKDLFEEN